MSLTHRTMSDITKAIRFSREEWEVIAQFLKQNPFFDFSSLARAAIQEFVRDPKLTFKGVNDLDLQRSRLSRAPEVRGPNG